MEAIAVDPLHPHVADARRRIAETYRAQGLLPEAERAYRLVLERYRTGTDLAAVRYALGDVLLQDQAVVGGDLTIDKPSARSNSRNRKPRVVIGPGSRVEGKIVILQQVELFISETARIGGVSGVMTLGDAVRFSGTRP